jgi:endonuclease YncB( thermonuclease family)
MLELLGGKLMIVLGLIVVGLIALAIVARNWSCREQRERRTRDRSATISGEVVDVMAGNRVTLAEHVGLRGRRTRHVEIRLAGIAVMPPDKPLGGEAQALLAELLPVGSTAEVELADRRSDDGVVWTAGRECCQERLLEVGLATLDGSDDPPDEWTAAEAGAKKAKIGLWTQ